MNSAAGTIIDGLREDVLVVAGGLPGRLGVALRFLEHDLEFCYKGEDVFPTASVIKLPIMVEAFRQVAEGTLRLDEPLATCTAEMVAGSGVLQFLHPGLELTLEDALELMIGVSDNTATNLVLARIGNEAVNRTMDNLGLVQTRSAGKIGGADRPVDGPRRSQSSPRDMAVLLTGIAQGTLVSETASDHMLRILGHQLYEEMVPRYLPLGFDPSETHCPPIVVAHKTGAVDHVRNDVGIIRLQSGTDIRTLIVAVFTADLDDGNLWTIENVGVRAVAEVSRLAFRALIALGA